MGRFLKILLMCSLFAFQLVAHAQEPTRLSLDIATTNLQTGQDYEIAIRIDNAPDFWTADLALDYDPSLIYIVGTKSGSPAAVGEIFTSETSVVVQNSVQSNRLVYTASKVGETTPAAGSGVIARFHVYPIAPGRTQITFNRAQLVALSSYDPNAANVSTVSIASTAVLLDLVITGNPVEPPSEATATPLPTETPTPVEGIGVNLTQQPTLVNVTAAPSAGATSVPLAILAVPTENETASPSVILLLAVAIMVIGGVGAIITFFLWRRSRSPAIVLFPPLIWLQEVPGPPPGPPPPRGDLMSILGRLFSSGGGFPILPVSALFSLVSSLFWSG